MSPEQAQRRKNIYLGKGLKAFFQRPGAAKESDSARLDTLVRRYEFLIMEGYPRRAQLHPVELAYLATIVRDWSAEEPADAGLLMVKLQQALDRQAHTGGVDVASLLYRLKGCKPIELVAIVEICERLLGEGAEPDRAAAEALLTDLGLR